MARITAPQPRLSLSLEPLEQRTLLSSGVPMPDHVVIVVEENHNRGEIIGNTAAPYLNGLANDASAALFTQSFAIEHPSQPNYLDLFSGSNQGITDDSVPSVLPFTTANLGASLLAAGKTFVGYSEDLPSVGFNGATSGAYARKHNPWVNWQGNGTNGIPTTANQPLTAFPTDFTKLPTLSIVVPNLNNDMHDGSVATGDAWLQEHLDNYVQWAKTHNSLLIVTFDEDDFAANNQIATLFVGGMVQNGQYAEPITHFNVLRTLEDMYGLPYAGQSAAAAPIVDAWAHPTTDSNGIFDPVAARWYLRNAIGNSGPPDAVFPFGPAGALPLSGDWNGDGKTTIGVFSATDPSGYGRFSLRNANSAGAPDSSFLYGLANWVPVTGRWSGGGATGIGVFDPVSATWFLRNTPTASGPPDYTFQYGFTGWIPVVGDWDGNGTATIGVFISATATWLLRNSNSPGPPDIQFSYGLGSWIPIVGDWDGEGKDTIGMFDTSTGAWLLRNSNTPGPPDIVFRYGVGSWKPVAGDWDGPSGAPQLAASAGKGADPLPADALSVVVNAAFARIAVAGVDPGLIADLRSTQFFIGNLPGNYVGLTIGHMVTIDTTAAGNGWFVDATADLDEEYALGADGAHPARPGSGAMGKMDLLTVVLHELGHVAGKASIGGGDGELMTLTLATGGRRVEALDAVFAGT